MKINFKKITALATSALMVGMTMGVAAAANFPAPFVSGGSANVAIVYGTGSGVSSLDLVEAGNIQANLQSFMTGTSTGTSSSATGGDSVSVGTSSRNLYYNDFLNAARGSLSASELPNVLKDGKFTDLSGTEYGYTQTIVLGNTVSRFGTSGGDLDDPVLYLDIGTTATSSLYNYTLSFNKNLNVSDATNVQGQKINILGIDYVIGASSTNTTLYLYGSGSSITVKGGESATVTVAGKDHTIELVTTSSASAGTIKVDGVQKSVVEGSSYAYSGDLNVYVKDIIHPAFQGDVRSAELIIGANTLLMANGTTVKTGADQTSIKNTLATISPAGIGQISGFTISVAAPKASQDSLVAGESFVDPVFGGLKVDFTGASPSLDSTSRGTIKVRTDNTQYAYVTFTSARAGTTGEQELLYAADNNTASNAVAPLLANRLIASYNGLNGKGLIHVKEGENASEGDWIVINQGDSGTILEVDSIDLATATSGTVTFVDAITGESQKVTLTNSSNLLYTKSGVNFFGGSGYTISTQNGSSTLVNVTWDGATAVSLFPRIKLANGGWMSFLTATNVSQANATGTTVIFPDGTTTIDTTGVAVTNTSVGNFSTVSRNGLTWGLFNYTGSPSGYNNEIYSVNTSTTAGCTFNSATGPAILFIEPKKWNDTSFGNAVCIPMTTAGTTEIAIGTPLINSSNSGFQTFTSDTYKSQAIDAYGALVQNEQRTNENGVATIMYPASQMLVDIRVSAEGATVTAGASAGGSTQLGNVLVKDSEVSSVSSKNLVVVGGSCINSAAATLVGGAKCGAAWTTATGVGAGEFLIKGYATSSLTSKVALLVAGYEATDTVNAATYLRTKTVDTSKTYKGTSSTSATLVTTTA